MHNQQRTLNIAAYSVLALAGGFSFFLPDALPVADAMPAPAGEENRAVFNVEGPVLDGADGRFGDAILVSTEYASGDIFTDFIMVQAIRDFQYDGPVDNMRVVTAHESREGDLGVHPLEDEDGDSSSVSQTDLDLFADRVLRAYQDRNLNHYIDLNSSREYSYIIELEHLIPDDDPELDEFGELLLFERGGGTGNSWIQLQAVDASGAPLADPYIVSPNDLYSTTPETWVGLYNGDGSARSSSSRQEFGAITIDITRLGVESVRHIKVSSPIVGEHGFGGGEVAADMKIFAVMTTPRRPALDRIYD